MKKDIEHADMADKRSKAQEYFRAFRSAKRREMTGEELRTLIEEVEAQQIDLRARIDSLRKEQKDMKVFSEDLKAYHDDLDRQLADAKKGKR